MVNLCLTKLPSPLNAEKIVFSINITKSGYNHNQKNELGPYPISYIKINSKWIRELHVKGKTIKLKENIGDKLHDVGVGKGFLDMTPEEQVTKEKIKWTT